MLTTVRLNDSLLVEAKNTARARNRTLTSLIEEGLRLAIARDHSSSEENAWVQLPVSNRSGGTLPGIDLNNNAALLDFMDQHPHS